MAAARAADGSMASEMGRTLSRVSLRGRLSLKSHSRQRIPTRLKVLGPFSNNVVRKNSVRSKAIRAGSWPLR
jgi:hypothetical protein